MLRLKVTLLLKSYYGLRRNYLLNKQLKVNKCSNNLLNDQTSKYK